MIVPMAEKMRPKWFYSIWFILVMLFLVLGPLGLPLLWKSPRFPLWAKILLTGAVLVYTLWLALFSYRMLQASLGNLQQLQMSLQ